jgi:hypothetical protein
MTHKEATMKRRSTPRWRQVLGKMALNLGKIVGTYRGSASGAQIIEIPGTPPSARAKKRQKRKRR